MRRLIPCLAALLCAAPLAAAEQDIAAGPHGVVEFMLASGNIACAYIPAGGTPVYEPRDGGPELICTRVEPRYVDVVLGPVGAPEVIEEPGEQGCCSVVPVLGYGNSWRMEPFSCLASRAGLACARDDGHGFLMNRAGISAN